jgi:beta-lactam-binding protein with PASTA domain
MKLGESLRRRRGKGGGSVWRRKGEDGKTYVSLGGADDDRLRLIGAVLGLALLGWFLGYLVATRIVFPAPPPPADLVAVPDIRNVGLAPGGERLAVVGLELGAVDSLKHPTVPAGLIVGQSPLPGQLALPGTQVRITKSLGPQTRSVPDVTRIAGDRARVILETSGFVVSIDTAESDLPRGRVVSSAPAADDTVALPAEIRLLVSRGPPLVPMPLLLGMEEAQAIATLDSLGLVVGEIGEVFRFGRDQGIVVEQEPSVDTPLERGTPVRLAIGRRGG